MLKLFGETKPEDIMTLQDKIAELEAMGGGSVGDSKIDEIMKTRLKPFERKETRLSLERDTAMQELAELKGRMVEANRDQTVMTLAAEKIQPQFLGDLKLRAKYELEYSDDMKSFQSSAGLTAEEWVAKQIESTPAWGLASTGAGARGPKGQVMGKNPFSKESLNLTEQGRLYKEDRAKYDRLKEQAGV